MHSFSYIKRQTKSEGQRCVHSLMAVVGRGSVSFESPAGRCRPTLRSFNSYGQREKGCWQGKRKSQVRRECAREIFCVARGRSAPRQVCSFSFDCIHTAGRERGSVCTGRGAARVTPSRLFSFRLCSLHVG